MTVPMRWAPWRSTARRSWRTIVVTAAEIDGDMLTFTPARDAHGDPYTTFTFTVNDGTDDSASAYTMTIDVTDAPAPRLRGAQISQAPAGAKSGPAR